MERLWSTDYNKLIEELKAGLSAVCRIESSTSFKGPKRQIAVEARYQDKYGFSIGSTGVSFFGPHIEEMDGPEDEYFILACKDLKLHWAYPPESMLETSPLSKDYKKLYELLVSGKQAIGLADYRFRNDDEVYRDPVTIYRRAEYQVFISARGTCYGHVMETPAKDGEYELFEHECNRLNLEWVVV